MPPSPYNFRSYFTLTNNPNNSTNAIAIYNCCIKKYGRLGIAQLKPECCTVNRACLCHIYLSKCKAFHETYNRGTDGKEFETNESVNLHAYLVISTISSHLSVNSRQSAISNFLCQPLLANDLLQFKQLLLRMIVSNALPFIFVENEDTIAVFEFLIPGLKLSKRKVIGGKQKKVLAMSQIWSDILWSRKIKISKKFDSQVHRLHVAASISLGDEGTKQELVNSNSDYQISDDGYYVEKDKTTRQTTKVLKKTNI
ncbi:10205_t:CDS:2 [Gigaspora margarita]|uniref:10205_t:CDS:1 n=1 Tax=Gigaspora margarita TaxID=4874 RepID=A0ABN7W3W4_GIGMA|nr:10205_t:CDS:2 [Gigaspora margarita]